MTISRPDRQARVLAWAQDAFGPDEATSIVHRGLRLLEEAVEAAQSAGVDRVQAHRLEEGMDAADPAGKPNRSVMSPATGAGRCGIARWASAVHASSVSTRAPVACFDPSNSKEA